MNAVEMEEAVSRLAGEPIDPQAFPFAFLEDLTRCASKQEKLNEKGKRGIQLPTAKIQEFCHKWQELSRVIYEQTGSDRNFASIRTPYDRLDFSRESMLKLEQILAG